MERVIKDDTSCLGIGSIVKILNHSNEKYINKLGKIISYDKKDINEFNYLQVNFELKILDIPNELNNSLTNAEFANIIHKYKNKLKSDSICIKSEKDFELIMWSAGIITGGKKDNTNIWLTCTAN